MLDATGSKVNASRVFRTLVGFVIVLLLILGLLWAKNSTSILGITNTSFWGALFAVVLMYAQYLYLLWSGPKSSRASNVYEGFTKVGECYVRILWEQDTILIVKESVGASLSLSIPPQYRGGSANPASTMMFGKAIREVMSKPESSILMRMLRKEI